MAEEDAERRTRRRRKVRWAFVYTKAVHSRVVGRYLGSGQVWDTKARYLFSYRIIK